MLEPCARTVRSTRCTFSVRLTDSLLVRCQIHVCLTFFRHIYLFCIFPVRKRVTLKQLTVLSPLSLLGSSTKEWLQLWGVCFAILSRILATKGEMIVILFLKKLTHFVSFTYFFSTTTAAIVNAIDSLIIIY